MTTSASSMPPDEPSKDEIRRKSFNTMFEIVADLYRNKNVSYMGAWAAIAQLGKADVADIKAISASQLELSAAYYHNPHKQSKQSFLLACVAAVICLISFVAAITILILQQPANIAYISMVGSAISALFGGVFYLIYRHASNQALAYKPQVDKIQQFIMANSACETLGEERKQIKREEIIDWILDRETHMSEGKK